MRGSVVGGLVAIGVLASVACGARTVIIAGQLVMPDGSLAEGKAVVVEDGVIRSVDRASDHADDPDAQRFPDAVLSPGLIDIGSQIAVVGNTAGGVSQIEPAISVIDAVDAARPELRPALEAGITSVHITPALNRIVAGASATIRTHVKDEEIGVVREDGPLVLSMGGQVFDLDLGPTSRSGAIFLLRDALEEAERSGAGDTLGERRLNDLLAGDLDAVAYCSSVDDADAMLLTLGEHAVAPAIMHTADALRLSENLEGERGPFIVGPLTFGSRPEQLAGPGALAAAGADVVLRGGTPALHPSGLRTSAALAIAYGLDPDDARAAITSRAAQVAGVADRVGSIKAGLAADLVLFSGDPARLDSRVLRVWSEGERVYVEPPRRDEIGVELTGGR